MPAEKFNEKKIRLQVFLSRNGVCSRRDAMGYVQGGRVILNGKIVREPSTPVDPVNDKIAVDGKVISAKLYEYVMLNKPAGFVTTKEDRFADKTVFDLLPKELYHLVPVGRLDKDTEGLILLTNDGDVAFALTHPSFNVDKTYWVAVYGVLSPEAKRKLENGVVIDGEKTARAKIKILNLAKDHTDLTITIHEGKKRQIRLMFASVEHPVRYLKRIEQGPLTLGNLKRGEWRKLTDKEIQLIKGLAQ